MADIELQQLLDVARDGLQTEEFLELFETRSVEFIDQHGVAGIEALQTRVLRFSNPVTEPLARRFIRALGDRRGTTIDRAAKQVLLAQLSSSSGGRRSAAASALGAFPSSATMTAFEQRAAVEKNRVVLATLQAHLRVFKANGISA